MIPKCGLEIPTIVCGLTRLTRVPTLSYRPTITKSEHAVERPFGLYVSDNNDRLHWNTACHVKISRVIILSVWAYSALLSLNCILKKVAILAVRLLQSLHACACPMI
jgi:hypothetical protein